MPQGQGQTDYLDDPKWDQRANATPEQAAEAIAQYEAVELDRLAKSRHYSAGKSGVDQIPADFLLELGYVYTMGGEKYGRDNWKNGTDWHEFYGSAQRHMLAFWGKGESMNPEDGGRHHLAHAVWNMIALWFYEEHGRGNDDRDRFTGREMTVSDLVALLQQRSAEPEPDPFFDPDPPVFEPATEDVAEPPALPSSPEDVRDDADAAAPIQEPALPPILCFCGEGGEAGHAPHLARYNFTTMPVDGNGEPVPEMYVVLPGGHTAWLGTPAPTASDSTEPSCFCGVPAEPHPQHLFNFSPFDTEETWLRKAKPYIVTAEGENKWLD